MVRVLGDHSPADIVKTSFLVPEPLTLSDIEDCFPFEGQFIFRYKLSREEFKRSRGIAISEDFLWVDLTCGTDVVIMDSQNSSSIELQATVIALLKYCRYHDKKKTTINLHHNMT